MLNRAEERPLWGVIPYRVAVPVLLALALLLTGALVYLLDRWRAGTEPESLFGAALIALLLGGTAVTSVLILNRYRKAQSELLRVQMLGRNILENMAGGVITLDLTGHFTLVNPAACRILEMPADRGSHTLEWVSMRQQRLGEVIREAVAGDQYVQDEDLAYRTSAGSQTWIRVTTFPLVGNDLAKEGAVVLVKDVTRLRAMEERLRRADRLAVTESLAAGVAHEVRNPLSAIELNLGLLQDEVLSKDPNAEEIRNYFEILMAETKRLNRITEDFLALSRPGSLRQRELSVPDVVGRVLRLLEGEAAERRVRFRTSIEQDLPNTLGDGERLEQVFLNVLINALDAMPGGGVIQVGAALQDKDGEPAIEVSITDQGTGIRPENLPRLFDPYFTTKPNGTGLGLAIAHRIVTDHKGEIIVESSPGAGTTVRVRLPVAVPAVEEPLAADGHDPSDPYAPAAVQRISSAR